MVKIQHIETEETQGILRTVFSDQNIIYILALSVFLPPVFTTIAIITMGLYVCISKHTRKRIFVHSGSKWLIPFFLISGGASAFYQNIPGLITTAILVFIFILGLFLRSAMTVKIFEHMLNIITMVSLPIGLVAAFEWIMLRVFDPTNQDNFRCVSIFFNSNYFATVVATVIMICAYKVGTHQGNRPLYFLIAGVNMFSAYLSGSLFVWVEIFIGVALIFFLMKKHEMLSGLLLGCALFCLVIYFAPGVFLPRLTESPVTTDRRFEIWETALRAFLKTPLFGRGPLTYLQVYSSIKDGYPTQHAHNMYLDPLLSFGLVGTTFLMIYVGSYLKTLWQCLKENRSEKISILICAIVAAVAVHGTTDFTVFWVQTGILIMLILSGIGICEKRKERSAMRHV